MTKKILSKKSLITNVFAMLLCIALLVSAVSCKTSKDPSDTTTEPSVTTPDPTDGTTSDPTDVTTAAPADGTTSDTADVTTATPTDGTTSDTADVTTASPTDATTTAPADVTTTEPENTTTPVVEEDPYKNRVSIDSEGYLVLDGVKTDVSVGTENANKHVYEAYCASHPLYTGTAEQWISDLESGKLAETRSYQLVSSDGALKGTLQKGTADKGNVSEAKIQLDDSVVLPLYDGATWSVEVNGVLLANKSAGGQFFSNTDAVKGKIYFASRYTNATNSILYIGLCVEKIYGNYCWTLPTATLAENHTYKFEFDGSSFLLSIDGGEAKHIDQYNVHQKSPVTVDGNAASAELLMRIRAMVGQDYLSMNFVGTDSHPCTVNFKDFKVTTSSIYSYEENKAHPLADKTLFYLGSSITRGHGGNTDGLSFADMISNLTGAEYQKEAVSGTNLATGSKANSYVERFANLDFSKNPDVLVLQLSTNDFKNGIAIGSIGADKSAASFASNTVIGAIETIIASALEKNPDIKIVLYTCPLSESWTAYNAYKSFVNETLPALESKWEGSLYVLDLFNGTYIDSPKYMQDDGLHPTKEGYSQMFTAQFISFLTEILK